MNTLHRRACAIVICVSLILPATPAGAIHLPEATPGGDLIVFFDEGTGAERIRKVLAEAGVSSDDIEVRRDDMALVRSDSGVTAAMVSSAIERADSVTSVGVDREVRALETVPPSDPAYTAGGYPQRDYLGPQDVAANSVHVEPVWDAVFNGTDFALAPGRAGVTVAVIDTGASPSLLEDSGDYAGVWDYVNDDADPTDDSASIGYHGTRVASIIRAETDNGAGLAGILHDLDSRLLVYKVLNSAGSGSSADSMQAMRDAADDGARVINLSFGERATTYTGLPDLAARAAWQDTVDYCVARGALVVAASGNDANRYPYYTPVFYPAACEGALAVGSIDAATGLRSDYSCYGSELDLVAPGRFKGLPTVGLWTAPPSGAADQAASGTSFAAPVVSGTAGLLWSLVPDLTAPRIAELLNSTANGDYGSAAGFDAETGWGLVDAWAAYGEMTSTIPAQAQVGVGASTPNGLETRVSWGAAAGTGVSYLYGYQGGPAYATTATSGRLVLPGHGTHTIWVRSFARDRWGAPLPSTTSVTVSATLASIESTRLAGDDRYETAAAVSRAAFAHSATAAVVALGSNWPDALAASVLASTAGGPILLTRGSSLPVATRDEILRLRPQVVYLVGGTLAVDSGVEDDLRALLPLDTSLVRLGGTDRYDTARLVAQRVTALPGGSGAQVVIASGENFPDALCAAPVAASAGWPILLTRETQLPGATRDALTQLGTVSSVVVGGEQAVSASVEAQVPAPRRWAGANRYDTSRVIADEGRALGLLDSARLGFATGRDFPDALNAGPHAGASGMAVVLTNGVDSALATWLERRSDSTESIGLYGGPAALSYDIEFDLLVALRQPQ